jgi:hypothetical protein
LHFLQQRILGRIHHLGIIFYRLSIIIYIFAASNNTLEMKPNTYRFNWTRFFAKRIYSWLIVLTVLAIFHIVNVMTSDNRKLVLQLESTSDSSQINQICSNLGLVHKYELQVDSSSWFYSLLIENNIGLSPLTTLVTLILASLGFVLRGAIDLKNPFSKDFSKPFIFAAVATLLLFILEYLAYRSISQSIELKQLEGFHIVRIDNFWLCFTSLALFWLASVMKKGYHLQNEQNLTI